MIGKVRWFDKAKGYGFIENDNYQDIFIHYSNIDVSGYKNLNEGDTVEFELVESNKGYHAEKLRIQNKKIIQTTK